MANFSGKKTSTKNWLTVAEGNTLILLRVACCISTTRQEVSVLNVEAKSGARIVSTTYWFGIFCT